MEPVLNPESSPSASALRLLTGKSLFQWKRKSKFTNHRFFDQPNLECVNCVDILRFFEKVCVNYFLSTVFFISEHYLNENH